MRGVGGAQSAQRTRGQDVIKAIETTYRGYRFRSRLEARWAVFFDALGLQWEYESEGFETSAGWYLPDFAIHRTRFDCDGDPLRDRLFLEVKPLCERGVEIPRLRSLINYFEENCGATNECGYDEAHVVFGDPLDWAEGALERNDKMFGMTAKFSYSSMRTPIQNRWAVQPCTEIELLSAASRGRSARFEHGQTPA